MSAAFTPGPWHLHDTENATVCGPGGRAIALCEARLLPGSVQDANARLIAAAPELYEALKHILDGSLSLPRFAEDEGRAALAKALGQ